MTCKLYNADDRALIVDLLQRYDDEAEIIESLKFVDFAESIELQLGAGAPHVITLEELIGVHTRRMDDIKNQLMNKGVELAESKPGLASIERHRRVDVGPGGMLHGDPLPVLADIGPQ